MEDKSSMFYWYPKIKDLNLHQPRTEMMEININRDKWIDFIDNKTIPFNFAELQTKCWSIGYPLFIRTDMASGKHGWKNSCFIEKEDNLLQNLRNVIEFSFMADILGLPINGLAIREYIPMKNLFTAFHGKMPVNPEIRFFAKNGKILCWHWYWVEDSIVSPSVENWKEIMEDAKKHEVDIERLTDVAEEVANVFKNDGYWSIDFCKAYDGRWILIDMAEGDKSWHEEGCKVKR